MANTTAFRGGDSQNCGDGKHNDPLILETVANLHITADKQATSLSCSRRNESKYFSWFCSVKKELVPLKVVLFCWFGGKGSGTLIGGNLIAAFGNRAAFRSMGIAAGIIGMAFALIHWLLIRCRGNRNRDPVV